MTPEQKLKKAADSNDKQMMDHLFEALYQDYAGLIGFVVSGYLSSQDKIQDIINESFFRLYENRDRIYNIKYFLVTTAKHLAIDEARRQSRYLPLDDNQDFPDETSPYSSQDYTELMRQIRTILSDKDLRILYCHLILDQTFKDIAEKTDEKEATIRTRYNRALKRLRKEGIDL